MSKPPPHRRFEHHAPRARLHPPEHVYPVDEWRLVEKRFYPRFLAQTETMFAVSNGYLGLRGDFEEALPAVAPGVFVNGFYESWPIVYGEEAYGFAKTGQTIVNVTDGKIIRLYVDDEPFDLSSANIVSFSRALDMRSGTLDREVVWDTPAGKRVSVKSKRLVSFRRRHLALISYEVTVENADAYLMLSSELRNRTRQGGNDGDPRRSQGFDGTCLELLTRQHDGQRVGLSYRTRQSGLSLACTVDHRVTTDNDYEYRYREMEHGARIEFPVEARRGEPVRLEKYLSYHHTDVATPEELCNRAGRTLDRAISLGAEKLFAEQREAVGEFWQRADVRIEGDPAVQQYVRFNLFELFQATARVEGYGVPAKGLTGQGYEGHYFWDAEIYVLPFLIYTAPRTARSLLQFRRRMLDKARARAGELGHRGALFPWRTINGEEASAYYAAGTAQYHINADIAYSIRKYTQATGDLSFTSSDGGGEIIVETARLWTDLGGYPKSMGGRFCINGVTGPDEYTAVVNNNRFTNMMAKENLRQAVDVVEAMMHLYPDDYAHLVNETGLHSDEIDEWRRAADSMCLLTDDKTGIHPQDDSFLEKEVWDFENTPPEKYPLLLHYHPLVLYRHQVIKQADVVMAMFLLGNHFSLEEKQRNFDYYDELTTRDSSLSGCIQSIVASELGYEDKAYEYFMDALLMDLADIGGNVIDGVHVASMGGTWMTLIYGFGGLRDYEGELSFHPRLPRQWKRMSFSLPRRNQVLQVDVDEDDTTYTLVEGKSILLSHEGEEFKLESGSPQTFPNSREPY